MNLALPLAPLTRAGGSHSLMATTMAEADLIVEAVALRPNGGAAQVSVRSTLMSGVPSPLVSISSFIGVPSPDHAP